MKNNKALIIKKITMGVFMKRIFLLAFFLVLPIHSFAKLQEANFILISESLYEGVLYKIKIDENFITKDDNKIGWILRDKIKCGKKDKYCVDKTRLEVNCKSGRAKILDIIYEKNTKVVNRKSFNDENWFSIESAASVAGMAFNFFCSKWTKEELTEGGSFLKYALDSVSGDSIKSFALINRVPCKEGSLNCSNGGFDVYYQKWESDCINKKSREIESALTLPNGESAYWKIGLGNVKISENYVLGEWKEWMPSFGKLICSKID